MTKPLQHRRTPAPTGEEGYLLVGLVVACFLLLLVLGVAAPRVSKELERDREVEATRRAQEYVRAIQLYYRRNNSFPASIDQLLGNGNGGTTSLTKIRYLRQRYKDPLTNDDFRLIALGQAKTEVKGFFGEPLQGAPVGNLGSLAGSASTFGAAAGTFGGTAVPGSTQAGGLGSTSGLGLTGSSAVSTTGVPGGISGTSGTTPATTSASGTDSGTTGTAGSTGTLGSTSAASFQGSKGMFVGVGSNAKGAGQIEWNGSANIQEWEFLYDPRVEALKARVSLFGGSPAATSGGLGGALPTAGTPGSVPGSTGATQGGAFGSSSGFGASSGFGTSSGFGSTAASGNASPTTGGTTSGAAASSQSGTTSGTLPQ